MNLISKFYIIYAILNAGFKGVERMRIVIQRVRHASVTIENKVHGKIEQGYMLLVGITHEDNENIVHKLADKCVHLRIFEDEMGKLNKSLLDIQGAVLSISQFTLYADCKKGRRPGFEPAAKPSLALPLYECFNDALREHGVVVETGVFGADMQVELCNDGPVTIVLDSNDL